MQDRAASSSVDDDCTRQAASSQIDNTFFQIVSNEGAPKDQGSVPIAIWISSQLLGVRDREAIFVVRPALLSMKPRIRCEPILELFVQLR